MNQLTFAAAGLCTSLGHSVPAVDAAIRAGIVNFVDSPWTSRRGEPMRAAPVDRLDWNASRRSRLQTLTAMALDQPWPFGPAGSMARPAIYLAAADNSSAHDVLEVLWRLLPGADSARVFTQGRGAFFFALAAAAAALSCGQVSSALVGGVDSLCTREMLTHLDRNDRLLGASHAGAVVPGEASAFVLLASSQTAASDPDRLGMLLATATEHETHCFLQDEPNRADALTQVFRRIFRNPASGTGRADAFHTCETGEAFWAEEVAVASLRVNALMPEPFSRLTAASAFGDLGAASGAVMLATGLRAAARQDSACATSRVLVCGSADAGHVGACLAQARGGMWQRT